MSEIDTAVLVAAIISAAVGMAFGFFLCYASYVS